MATIQEATSNSEGELRFLLKKHLPRKIPSLLLTGQGISRGEYEFSSPTELNVQITRLKVIIDAGSLV